MPRGGPRHVDSLRVGLAIAAAAGRLPDRDRSMECSAELCVEGCVHREGGGRGSDQFWVGRAPGTRGRHSRRGGRGRSLAVAATLAPRRAGRRAVVRREQLCRGGRGRRGGRRIAIGTGSAGRDFEVPRCCLRARAASGTRPDSAAGPSFCVAARDSTRAHPRRDFTGPVTGSAVTGRRLGRSSPGTRLGYRSRYWRWLWRGWRCDRTVVACGPRCARGSSAYGDPS